MAIDSNHNKGSKTHSFPNELPQVKQEIPPLIGYTGVLLATIVLAISVSLARGSAFEPLRTKVKASVEKFAEPFYSRPQDKLPVRNYDPKNYAEETKPEPEPVYLSRGSFSKARTVTYAPSSNNTARARLNRPKSAEVVTRSKCKGRKGLKCHKSLKRTGLRKGCRKSFLR
jgi:hypothetical protein